MKKTEPQTAPAPPTAPSATPHTSGISERRRLTPNHRLGTNHRLGKGTPRSTDASHSKSAHTLRTSHISTKEIIGLFLGFLAFIVPLIADVPNLEESGERTLAIFLVAIVFWITEPIPLTATAVLVILLEVLLVSTEGFGLSPDALESALPAASYFAALANPVIILFLGGFLIADGDELALVLCDHRLPGTSGVEYLVEMMADDRTATTRKVLVTGQADLKDTVRAVNEAKLDRYIAKPWDVTELRDVVRELLTDYVEMTGLNPLPYMPALNPERAMDMVRDMGSAD